MKNLSIKIAAMCFMAIVACPCVMADEKIDLDMVKIPGKNFEMLRTEVTQELYEAVMGVNPSILKGDVFPVECVSWYDAIEFCNELSKKLGYELVYTKSGNSVAQNVNANGFRLPTVEEWQFAARGGQNFRYSGSDNLDSVGWYLGNSKSKTHPVAQKKNNGYKLYDMSGNACEWCWDSDGDEYRSFCGGCWGYDAESCKVDEKNRWYASIGISIIGFRIVRTTK